MDDMRVTELETISKFITDYNGSEEGLKDIFISISDYFSKLKHNLKRQISQKNGKFYSSELVIFSNHNKAKLKDFFKNKRFIPFGHIEVEHPDKFKSTYPSCIKDIDKLNNRLNIDVTITSAVAIVNKIVGGNMNASIISDMIRFSRSNSKVTATDMRNFHNDHFSKTSAKTKVLPAKDLIGTFTELEFCYHELLKYDVEFKNAEAIYNKLDELDKLMDRFFSKTEKKELTIDKRFLRQFYGFLSSLSHQVDAYGILLHTQQQLEHNYVFGIRRIIRLT